MKYSVKLQACRSPNIKSIRHERDVGGGNDDCSFVILSVSPPMVLGSAKALLDSSDHPCYIPCHQKLLYSHHKTPQSFLSCDITAKDLKPFHMHNDKHNLAPRVQKAFSPSNSLAFLVQRSASLPNSLRSHISKARFSTSTGRKTTTSSYRLSPRPPTTSANHFRSFAKVVTAGVCSCKEKPRQHIWTAAGGCVCWYLKVFGARTGCGMFQFHGEEGEGVYAGNSD